MQFAENLKILLRSNSPPIPTPYEGSLERTCENSKCGSITKIRYPFPVAHTAPAPARREAAPSGDRVTAREGSGILNKPFSSSCTETVRSSLESLALSSTMPGPAYWTMEFQTASHSVSIEVCITIFLRGTVRSMITRNAPSEHVLLPQGFFVDNSLWTGF